jgi:hypothetical protein
MARLAELSGLSFARIFDRMPRVNVSLAHEIQLEPPYGIGLNTPTTVILECNRISRAFDDTRASSDAAVAAAEFRPGGHPRAYLGTDLFRPICLYVPAFPLLGFVPKLAIGNKNRAPSALRSPRKLLKLVFRDPPLAPRRLCQWLVAIGAR